MAVVQGATDAATSVRSPCALSTLHSPWRIHPMSVSGLFPSCVSCHGVWQFGRWFEIVCGQMNRCMNLIIGFQFIDAVTSFNSSFSQLMFDCKETHPLLDMLRHETFTHPRRVWGCVAPCHRNSAKKFAKNNSKNKPKQNNHRTPPPSRIPKSQLNFKFEICWWGVFLNHELELKSSSKCALLLLKISGVMRWPVTRFLGSEPWLLPDSSGLLPPQRPPPTSYRLLTTPAFSVGQGTAIVNIAAASIHLLLHRQFPSPLFKLLVPTRRTIASMSFPKQRTEVPPYYLHEGAKVSRFPGASLTPNVLPTRIIATAV